MDSKLIRYSLLGASFFSGYASAIGLGEISLHSALGENLRAEIPLISVGSEAVDTACFSLSPLPGTDLPVVTNARIRLVRGQSGYRLLIVGNRPLGEPVFMLGVRASCGIDLQRDYTLIPDVPTSLGDSIQVPATSTAPVASRTRPGRSMRSGPGDSLESIAASLAPNNSALQRRTLTALRRNNPELDPEALLPEGTEVRVPSLKQRAAAESQPAATPSREAAYRPPRRERVAMPPAKGPAANGDKLVIGDAPGELRPGEKATARSNNIGEMEERMLKLETTLSTLNAEVDKLNTALTLTTEALAAQTKLQLAQSTQPVAIAARPPTPPEPPQSSRGNWLELFFSALAGGGIAAGLAGYLGRRRANNDPEMPLAVSGYRAEVVVSPPPAPQPAPPTSTPGVNKLSKVDIPLSSLSEAPSGTGAGINLNENDSALELAEIMLSFGRVRGAAETLALYIEESSPNNIHPWLMLLDLYRRGDMREEFETLRPNIEKKFNLNVPAWNDSNTPVSGLKSLEDYAHIIGRVVGAWGEQASLDYLYDLVHDNRSGQRSGFPLEVVEEIALLMRVLEDAYGLQRPL